MDEQVKSLDSAEKQQRINRLKPFRFKKGESGNPNGRPKSFDQFKALAQEVANEELTLGDGRKISVAEAMLRKCAKSNEAQLIKTFFEYAFGKVPDKIEATGLENKTTLVLHFDHEKGITQS